MKVRLFKPSIGQEELRAIAETFDREWLGLGPRVAEFEERWSRYLGCSHSIAVNSGTAALHLALAAFGFSEGKKVLVPAITFMSTAAAVLYNRLEPVFVDSDEETLGMDLQDLKKKISPDCVAVMVVHMGGHPAPMEQLLEIAGKHNLTIIEDCAHCAGGEYKGKKLGTWGHMGCFSFEEKKCMTTGDGGMICTDRGEVLERLQAMRWMGIDRDTWRRSASYTEEDENVRHWYYDISLLGYKYNMNDLCASIGLVQLKKLDLMNAARTRAIKRYMAGLEGLRKVRPLLPYDFNSGCAYWIFGLRTRHRDHLMHHLKTRGIATGVHYTPLPLLPIFLEHTGRIPVAQKVYDEIITLPLYADITDRQIDHVVHAVRGWESGL